jgi:thiamine pyrophosphate-dependent acetolactate synthase large subunit-like protein
MSGGQAAVVSLKKEKVGHVFGLIGSATMEMFDALYHEKKIKFIGVRDERTGTHMADGYARASNKPGVIIAGQNGPGATNLVTGVAQAKAAFSPVVAIAGSYSTKDKMEDAFQGLDQQSLFTPITKKTWTVKNSKIIPKVISDAFSLAMTPRRGPVCVNLPRNILAATNDYNINTDKPSFYNESTLRSKNENIKKAAKIINQAKQFVIIAGGGIKYTAKYKEVIKLAELLNVPIVTAAGHGDAIPFSHKLNAGQMGPRGNPVASKLVKEANVILAIGTRLGFNSTFYSYDNINKKAKIIQIEIEKKMLGKYFPIIVGINADAATATKQIYNEIKKQRIKLDIKNWTNSYLKERKDFLINRDKDNLGKNFPIQPKGLFKQLRKVLPKDTAITLDAGTLCLQATDALRILQSTIFIYPFRFWVSWFFICLWSWC